MNTKSEKNYFFKSSELKSGLSSIALFGFELINIHLESSYNPDSFLARANAWNRQFLNALSLNPVDCTAFIKIRKNVANKQPQEKPLLRIAVLFRVKPAKGSDPVIDAKNLRADVEVLFRPVNGFHANTFIFVPISSKQHLNDFIRQPKKGLTFDYARKPVRFKRNAPAIGYRTRKNLPESLDFVPQFFTPDYYSLGNVATRLALAQGFTDLTYSITPLTIPQKEIKDLKDYQKNYHLIDDSFTTSEKEEYLKQLELLFDDNTNHFIFRVKWHVEEATDAGRAMHNAIADAFFGNIPFVEFSETKPVRSLIADFQDDKANRNRYLYSVELLQNTFRLPSSAHLPVSWFAQSSDIFTFFPEEIPDTGVLMGIKKIPYQKKEVRIRSNDLAQHMYILGQTGVGKTTLLKTMILNQMKNGEGICVIDPHGDLVSALLDQIPEHRKNDVIEFDPTQMQNIRINMLEYDHDFPEQKTLIFNELIRQFDEIYNMREAGGPIFEQYIKSGMWLVMEFGGTLFDLYRLFHDTDYRKQLLSASKQANVVLFFKNAEKVNGEASMNNIANYITSKLNRYVQDDFIGPILSEPKSSISFREVIDKSQIFLVRLPKGRIGSDGVKFIGRLLFNKFTMAAYTRENIPLQQRVPFYMYIDEFQNFTTRDVETALSESRKYGLSLILANQTLSQLTHDMVRTILGNVGSQVFFRPGSFDIEVLSPYFKYDIGEKEILGLRNFQALARLLNNAMPMKPFIFETLVGDPC